MCPRAGERPRTVLLLDVMDTLVRDPFRDIPAFFDTTWDALRKVKHPDSWPRFERAEMTGREFLDTFFADQRPFDHGAFEQMIRDGYHWIDGIVPLLERITAHGRAELHTLSNYPEWYGWIEEKLRVSRFVAWSFVSCTVGIRKPDPALYETVISSLGLGPLDAPGAPRCLFVDDRAKNLEPAAALGMRTHLFRGAGALEAWLVDEGALPTPG